jgi:hypothetical protein
VNNYRPLFFVAFFKYVEIKKFRHRACGFSSDGKMERSILIVEFTHRSIKDGMALREAVIVPSAVLIIYWRRNPGHSTPAEAEPV